MAGSANGTAHPQDGDLAGQPSWLRPPSALTSIWTVLQRTLSFGVMHVSSALRNYDRAFVRARPQTVRIEESYYFFQEISQNPHGYEKSAPDGYIEMYIPYDGERYFSRGARRDAERSRPGDGPMPANALIGHLALSNYQHTDLDELLGLGARYGSLPICIPLDSGSGQDDELVADRSACVISYEYAPGTRQRRIDPVHIDVQLDDLDTTGSRPMARRSSSEWLLRRLANEAEALSREEAASGEAPRGASGTAAIPVTRIMQRVDFRPEILLSVTMSLHLEKRLARGARPEIRKFSIKWPTHTSLRSLNLKVDQKDHHLQYNPEKECLEWWAVPLKEDSSRPGGDFCVFRSDEMMLSIPQPGELYREQKLEGTAEITVNRLLSGMSARFFDATGRLSESPRPELESVVYTDFELYLDDVFSRRTYSPHQQLHFDEVLPSEMRIDDIKTALGNLGFRVEEHWRERGPTDRLLLAERKEGPDTLRLELYVMGRMHRSRRERKVPGGVTYQTHLESGELRIYIYGSQPRDSAQVVREMNNLRRALHERFDRLPARR
jgi:hypothetical protein